MNFHKNHWLLFSFTFFGFVGLSLIVGILPAIWVQNNAKPLPGAEPLTVLESKGLGVYIGEGCVACHTQQVRPLEMDLPWGRPAAPGDYAYVTPLGPWAPYAPAVLGSQRTGPDLTNIGQRQASDVWNYLHFYNPRSVVPDSIMPAYPWLFEIVSEVPEGKAAVPLPAPYAPEEGKFVIPNERGEALVAYMLSLKQLPLVAEAEPEVAVSEPEAEATPAALEAEQAATEDAATEAAEPEAEASAPEPEAQAPAPEPEAAAPEQEAAEPAETTAEETAGATAPETAAVAEWDSELGDSMYANHCVACHQANGTGLAAVFPPLTGNKVVLDDDPTEHIRTVLEGKSGSTIDGVTYASPMPAFAAQLSDEQLAAVVNHERSSWGNDALLVTPADVAAVRGGTP